MKVYVASSWRNERQLLVVAALRADGHEVYDFRSPEEGDHGFSWRQITDTPRPWDGALTREVLAHPVVVRGFGLDHAAMEWADATVMVLPCGKSAHLELGWACGRGKLAFVLYDGPDEPELMYRETYERGGGLVVELDELLAALRGRDPSPDLAAEIVALRARVAALEAERVAYQDALAAIHRATGRGDGHTTPRDTADCCVSAFATARLDHGEERSEWARERDDLVERLDSYERGWTAKAGAEAEDLRRAVEQALVEDAVDEDYHTLAGYVQAALDEVDARDSLRWLEEHDTLVELVEVDHG